MYPVHPTSNNTETTVTTLSPPHLLSNASTSRHGRKLSHVQFGKRSYSGHDDYASSILTMPPLDETVLKKKPSLFQKLERSSSISSNQQETTTSSSDGEKGDEKNMIDTTTNTKRRFTTWLFTTKNIGPFTKGSHWSLFTYLMVAFTVIIFSGELLISKQSSGEFFELEPFNYMLGPSLEIMIQAGARFPPCMRVVDSMPPDQSYICLHTQQEPNLISSAALVNSNQTLPPILHQQLVLLDPVINLTDPRLLNSTCSLQSVCGMTEFHQDQIPDQTYRLLTPLFIHTGIIHLCINLAVLILFGVKIERTINSVRFSILYVCSGVFGHALGSNIAPSTTPFLGCSSALFGLVGFLYVDLLINWKKLEQPIKNLLKLVVCTAFTFLLGLLPGVDTFSHMGGLAAGVLLGFFLIPVSWWPSHHRSSKKRVLFLYGVRVLGVCLFALFLGLLVHFFSIGKLDKVCPYCRYISCLPINGFCD